MRKSLNSLMNNYFHLTKIKIVIFAFLTASAAYVLSLDHFLEFSFENFIVFLLGFYLVCSGSFILNQAQEWSLDQKMERTRFRPIPSGKISPFQAYFLSFVFIIFGSGVLYLLQPLTAGMALLTVVLYNGFYTLFWKRYFKYGAVLGAVPGALPPVIGYSLGDTNILSGECVYLFLLLFFWQMPHFWSLAIRYQADYKKAGFPVLPVIDGHNKTLYQIGCYMLAYLGLALMSPLFLGAGFMYLILLLPLVLILLYQFFRYYSDPSQWLRFFLWINFSIIIYFAAPLLDKWIFYQVAGL